MKKIRQILLILGISTFASVSQAGISLEWDVVPTNNTVTTNTTYGISVWAETWYEHWTGHAHYFEHYVELWKDGVLVEDLWNEDQLLYYGNEAHVGTVQYRAYAMAIEEWEIVDEDGEPTGDCDGEEFEAEIFKTLTVKEPSGPPPQTGTMEGAIEYTNITMPENSSDLFLTLRGWAAHIDSGAPLHRIEIIAQIDGIDVSLGNATLGIPRTDISAEYGKENYLNSGWELSTNVKNKCKLGVSYIVRLMGYPPDGSAVEILTTRVHIAPRVFIYYGESVIVDAAATITVPGELWGMVMEYSSPASSRFIEPGVSTINYDLRDVSGKLEFTPHRYMIGASALGDWRVRMKTRQRDSNKWLQFPYILVSVDRGLAQGIFHPKKLTYGTPLDSRHLDARFFNPHTMILSADTIMYTVVTSDNPTVPIGSTLSAGTVLPVGRYGVEASISGRETHQAASVVTIITVTAAQQDRDQDGYDDLTESQLGTNPTGTPQTGNAASFELDILTPVSH